MLGFLRNQESLHSNGFFTKIGPSKYDKHPPESNPKRYLYNYSLFPVD